MNKYIIRKYGVRLNDIEQTKYCVYCREGDLVLLDSIGYPCNEISLLEN